jgi:hypothetical protein
MSFPGGHGTKTAASVEKEVLQHVTLPSGEQTVDISLIAAANFGPAVLKRFMSPLVPHVHTLKTKSPSLSFLIQHPSGRRLVWDLDIRKDWQNYAPSIANYIPTTGYEILCERNVVEVLEKHGVKAETVEAVIWRYVRA